MWRKCKEDVNTPEISIAKACLRSGGEIWIGVDKGDLHATSVVQQGISNVNGPIKKYVYFLRNRPAAPTWI